MICSSCSCAIYHKEWKVDEPAKPNTLVPDLTNLEVVQRQSEYWIQPQQSKVVLFSKFCPTPWTLLTGGADVEAWEGRCNKYEAEMLNYFDAKGVKLYEATFSDITKSGTLLR